MLKTWLSPSATPTWEPAFLEVGGDQGGASGIAGAVGSIRLTVHRSLAASGVAGAASAATATAIRGLRASGFAGGVASAVIEDTAVPLQASGVAGSVASAAANRIRQIAASGFAGSAASAVLGVHRQLAASGTAAGTSRLVLVATRDVLHVDHAFEFPLVPTRVLTEALFAVPQLSLALPVTAEASVATPVFTPLATFEHGFSCTTPVVSVPLSSSGGIATPVYTTLLEFSAVLPTTELLQGVVGVTWTLDAAFSSPPAVTTPVVPLVDLISGS